MKKTIALLISACLLFALASVALAHAQIASCTPPINGTVDTAPATLTCTTTQAMDPKASSLNVVDSKGAKVDKGDSAVDLNNPDRTTISVSLDTSKMPDGVYTVNWITLSADDGDAANGTFNFSVGMAMQMNTTPAAGSTPNAMPFEGRINIVDPAPDDVVVAGPVEVSVSVEGVTLGDQYHWHLHVDGTEVTMVMEGKSAYTTNLTAGKHTLKVSLADSTHDELTSATEDINVLTPAEATAAAPTGEATTAPSAGTPTAEATAMQMEMTPTAPATAMEMEMTPTAEATLAPAAATAAPGASPTASAPATLPTTGGKGEFGTGALVALVGVVLLAFGAFVTVRARR